MVLLWYWKGGRERESDKSVLREEATTAWKHELGGRILFSFSLSLALASNLWIKKNTRVVFTFKSSSLHISLSFEAVGWAHKRRGEGWDGICYWGRVPMGRFEPSFKVKRKYLQVRRATLLLVVS
jgi:hypothetical protein